MFRKELTTLVRRTGTIVSPYGEITVEERQDYFRLIFDNGLCFFVRAEGDLLRISFNLLGSGWFEDDLSYVLWLLNSEEIAAIINPKFGNNPELRFTAALYATTDKDKRSCVLLPSDTPETAMQRLNEVWFKQAPIPGYVGKIATYVE